MGEGDRIQWRGVRPVNPEEIFTRFEPPHGCYYVDAQASGGVGERTVYTVPANEMFYMTSLGFSCYGTANGTGYFRIYNTTPAVHRHLFSLQVESGRGQNINVNFNIAMQLPALYTVRIESGIAGVNVVGYVVGYTRDV